MSVPGFIPVCSLGMCQIGRMDFGKDVSTLKYFTICGLQEGYEPFAVNMNRDVTMWLSKRLPQFVPVPPNHQHIEVSRVSNCDIVLSTVTTNQVPMWLLNNTLYLGSEHQL